MRGLIALVACLVVACDLDLPPPLDADSGTASAAAASAASTASAASGSGADGGAGTAGQGAGTGAGGEPGNGGAANGGTGGIDCQGPSLGAGGADDTCMPLGCPQGTVCKEGCCNVVSAPVVCGDAIELSSFRCLLWSGCDGYPTGNPQGAPNPFLVLNAGQNSEQSGHRFLVRFNQYVEMSGCAPGDIQGSADCGDDERYWYTSVPEDWGRVSFSVEVLGVPLRIEVDPVGDPPCDAPAPGEP